MDTVTDTVDLDNRTVDTMTIVSAPNSSIDIKNNNGTTKEQSILIIQGSIASLGIITNLTVNVVFLNHKKLSLKPFFINNGNNGGVPHIKSL